jgi:hypothetical protein
MPTPNSSTHPPSGDGSPATISQDDYNLLKHKYEQATHGSGKKRRNPNRPTAEQRARGIRKLVTLHENISHLVAVAQAQDEDGGNPDDDETASEEERRVCRIE